MAGFDIEAARREGYSDAEIAAYLAQSGRSMPSARQPVQTGKTLDPTLFPESTMSPTSGMSDLELTRAGIGRGLLHTGRSVGNMMGLVPNDVLEEEQHLDAPLLATPSGRFGNIVGESAATAPLGVGAGAALERAAPTLARSLVASGATQGAVQGAATSEPGDRAKNALVGALTGGALGAGASGTRAAIYGVQRTPEVQRLVDQLPPGTLTPGQMNPRGTMNLFEQASESLGGLKPIVEGARDSAEHAWQTRVIQEGAAPGTTIKPSSDMHDMLRQAYESYAPLYDQARGIPVRPAIMNGPQGVKLAPVFDQIAQLPGTTQDAQQAARGFLQNELTRLPQQNLTSDSLLELRSNIRAQLRTARLANDSVSQDKAQIYAAADQAVTRSLNSQLPPQALQALQTADGAYGRYKVLENAVAASKDQVAGLTPAKLSQAVYNATPDQLYALGGGGSLRQLASDGAQVFQNVSPPTGARAVSLAPLAAAAIAHPVAIGVPMVAGGLGMVGTQTGRKLAAGQTMPQQAVQSLTDALSGGVQALPFGSDIQGAAGQIAGRAATAAALPYGQQAAPAALASALMYAQKQLQPQPEGH